MPMELAQVLEVETLAQRYHCLPSEVRAADPYNLKHLAILHLAGVLEQTTQPDPAVEDPYL